MNNGKNNKYFLKVHTRSSFNRVVQNKEFFEVWVSSPPHNNQANVKVIELISSYLNVPKTTINIVRGNNSNFKLVEVLE